MADTVNGFWTVWVLGTDGYWQHYESHSTRKAAETALGDYKGRAVRLRDPLDRVRLEKVA